MPTNRRIFSQDAAAAVAGDPDAAQGLVLHLDANDEDSIESGGANTGSGSGTWFDIANHDLNVPLVDKASNLVLNLDGGIYTSGAWQDQTTNGNDASLNGDAAYNSDVRGYFTLDGTGDYLQISDSSSLNLGAATYEMWFRQHVLAASEHLFGRYEGAGNRDLFISTGSSGAISLHFYDGTNSVGNISSGGSKYTANTWHHVAVTLSSGSTGGTVKLYIDGTLEGSTTLSGNRVTDAAADLFLGRLGSGNAFELDGDIGTTRIYNVALTASEVAQNFRAGNFLSYDSIYSNDLQANFDAANYTSGNWVDSVNSNSGTLNNMTVSANFDKELGNFFDFLNAGSNASDNQNITVPDSSSLSPTSTLSIEVIVNPDSFSNHQRIVWKDGSYGLYASASGVYTFFINSPSTAVTATLFETGKFKHIVGTYDGANMKIYINGILKTSVSNTASITDNTNNFTIGGDGSSQRYYNGQIGFVRLFSSALSDAQVAQNYLATKNDYPNAYHATIDGATFSATTPAYFDLDGSNDHIDTTFKNTALEEFTISAYIRFGTLPASNAYFINDTTNANEYSATFLLGYLASNGNWILHIGNGSSGTNGTISVSSGMEANHWTHIVFTCDGINDTVKYYKNGSLSATMLDGTATNIGSFSNTGTMQLGRFVGANNFHTDIDFGQFKIFNKTLSASEVLAEFNATKTPYPAADFT